MMSFANRKQFEVWRQRYLAANNVMYFDSQLTMVLNSFLIAQSGGEKREGSTKPKSMISRGKFIGRPTDDDFCESKKVWCRATTLSGGQKTWWVLQAKAIMKSGGNVIEQLTKWIVLHGEKKLDIGRQRHRAAATSSGGLRRDVVCQPINYDIERLSHPVIRRQKM